VLTSVNLASHLQRRGAKAKKVAAKASNVPDGDVDMDNGGEEEEAVAQKEEEEEDKKLHGKGEVHAEADTQANAGDAADTDDPQIIDEDQKGDEVDMGAADGHDVVRHSLVVHCLGQAVLPSCIRLPVALQ
jgi:hypothetical protein